MFALVEVPEHSNTIFAAGSAKGTIGGDSHGVDGAGVSNVVGAKLEAGKIPHLDNFIPSTRDDDRVARVRGEANTGDPVGMAISGDIELALSKGVPELDGLITRTRNNLTVVGREGNRQNVLKGYIMNGAFLR